MRALEGFHERYALNSRLSADNGRLVEDVYRVGGRYDREIRRIVTHLTDAVAFAPPRMAEALTALIRFYQTGEEADRIAYDIAWVRDQESRSTRSWLLEVYLVSRRQARGGHGLLRHPTDPHSALAATRRVEITAVGPEFPKAEVTG